MEFQIIPFITSRKLNYESLEMITINLEGETDKTVFSIVQYSQSEIWTKMERHLGLST